jgi:tartrate dehydratase alpha subunit/fumarate hydratase class I-like protein
MERKEIISTVECSAINGDPAVVCEELIGIAMSLPIDHIEAKKSELSDKGEWGEYDKWAIAAMIKNHQLA